MDYKLGDKVKLNPAYTRVFGHLTYTIIKVRGFWIFKSYDIEAYDDNSNKITQEKVYSHQLLEVFSWNEK